MDARGAQHRPYVLNHVLTVEITAAVAAANLKVTVGTVRRPSPRRSGRDRRVSAVSVLRDRGNGVT
jgi:hypothetical protein